MRQGLTQGLAGLAALVATAAPVCAQERFWTDVRDLEFGEGLYQFYDRQYFTAATHLMAAQQQQRLPHHTDEAELLRGGLLLSYGMHREAAEIFERLLERGAPVDVRDRAWFFLAKALYQRGHYAEAEQSLGQITARLAGELEEERVLLQSYLFMQREDFQGAAELLTGYRGKSEWAHYARYNLGVALVRAEHTDEGVALLDEVGRIRGDGAEFSGLRDKANVALGYAFLRDSKPALAKPYLEAVRYEGLLANKALLGAGWADSAEGRHAKAAIYWSVLRDRDVLDGAVQEALLALPYAYGQLGANRQALFHYEEAIATFQREIQRIDESVQAIERGRLTDGLITASVPDESGWFFEMKHLPDTPETHYLTHLMAQHEFHEALKQFRDLRWLTQNLAHWARSMSALDNMLATRRDAFWDRSSRVARDTGVAEWQRLKTRRDALQADIGRIEASQDVAALATPKEAEALTRLARVEHTLGKADDATRERFRRLRGLLHWDLTVAFVPRLWEAKRNLKETDEALAAVTAARTAVTAARERAPALFEGYGGRIAEQRARVQRLKADVAAAEVAVRVHLNTLAANELKKQRERLGIYLTQARFGRAQAYDHALVSPEHGP